MRENESTAHDTKIGIAWLALCASLMIHVTDEALTGFLSVYNPSVIAIRRTIPWFPMPVFGFGEWLGGLIAANVVLLALTPFAFRGTRWLRPLAYVFAIVMLMNGVGHTLGTIFGRTFGEVRFPRPMPGFYSSPGLLAVSIYMLVRLRAPAGGKKLGHDAHVAA